MAEIKKLQARLQFISAVSPFLSGILLRFIVLTKLSVGALSCLRQIGVRRPMVMNDFVGNPSFRPLFDARLLSVSVMVKKQNAYLRRAPPAQAAPARLIVLTWPQSRNPPACFATHITGMPVPTAFVAKRQPTCAGDSLSLTVLGGSHGATILGTLLPDALDIIDRPLRDKIKNYQQAAPEQVDTLKARYWAIGMTASIKPC